MAFEYSVYLPGQNKAVWAKEINSRVYRELVKSLFSTDDSSFILHSNKLIEEICPGLLEKELNIIDKLILLVNARAVCVNPDLKVQTTCPITKKQFEYTIQLDIIFNALTNIKYKNIIEHNNIIVEFSIVKAKDEAYFLEKDPEKLFLYQIASSIDKIIVKEKTISFASLSMQERVTVIENLPSHIAVSVLQKLLEVEKELNKNNLILINSPYADAVAVSIVLSTDLGIILQFCKILFSDELSNIYKLVFNLIERAGFTGEYIDKITPAEMYLYWSFYLEKSEQEAKQYSNTNSGTPFQGATFPPS
jgi:hypothetical protein